MYCSKCGKEIDNEAVVCPMCGVATQNFNAQQQPQVVINNANTNTNTNVNQNAVGVGIVGRARNKWVALALCLFLGVAGAHKFYEGNISKGVLYLFTGGLFGIGIIVDLFSILFKPNPYYV